MTTIKYIIILLFACACGREVKFNNNNLESNSKLSESKIESFYKSGTLTKKSPSTVTYQGQSYTVSIYSSKNANDFIASLANGSQVAIKFTGGTTGREIILETVVRQ